MPAPQQVVVADFEEGAAGAVVSGSEALIEPRGWGSSDQLNISDATYSTDAHGGSLSALIDSGAGGNPRVLVQSSETDRVAGGGGWFKIKTQHPNNANIADARYIDPGGVGGTGRGVLLRQSGGNVAAVDPLNTATVYGTVPVILNQWLYLSMSPAGAWSFGTAGGTLLSGSVTAPADGNFSAFTWTAYAQNSPAQMVVDDVWLWWRDLDGPVVRLYPRDDGRGMSSAPRIFPLPKSGRIIGGHQ